MEYPYKNDRKISRSFSLLILFTLININLAILFSPINACDLFLLNRGNTLGCGGLCPPSCGLSLLNLASPFQGALPLPPQPPPTILQPQIPAAYTAPRLLPPPFFRAPSLLPPPPILPNVLAPPIVQTAPIVCLGILFQLKIKFIQRFPLQKYCSLRSLIFQHKVQKYS
ncbi:unnamed protein product [Meloidogyne enterolobii]|uniref:Uncharacterized protein n=1 Tax=Meloidogyne enterolobii TaxID=390850 RepID=A0ACB1AXY8_MELEN